MEELIQQVAELKQKMVELDTKLNQLHAWIKEDGARVTEHMDFVEQVKQTFVYMMENINHVLYNNNPFIDYQEIG